MGWAVVLASLIGFRSVGPFVIMMREVIVNDFKPFFMVYLVMNIGFTKAVFYLVDSCHDCVPKSFFRYLIDFMLTPLGIFNFAIYDTGYGRPSPPLPSAWRARKHPAPHPPGCIPSPAMSHGLYPFPISRHVTEASGSPAPHDACAHLPHSHGRCPVPLHMPAPSRSPHPNPRAKQGLRTGGGGRWSPLKERGGGGWGGHTGTPDRIIQKRLFS